MRYSEIKIVETKIDEVPDDGSRAGQEPNRPVETTGVEAGPPYPEEQMDTVRQMQTKLEELGYNVGHTGVDGKYGTRTTRAVRAFKTDFDISSPANAMSAQELATLNSSEPVENPTSTGNEGHHYTSRSGGSDDLGDIEFAQGEGTGRVRMANSGATRNQALQASLMNILNTAAEAAGVDVVVFSGGQDRQGTPGARRTGSVRHDQGRAADIWIYSEGRRLRTDREDPIVSNFIAQAVAAGARGIGAGPGYMGGVGIHVDILGDRAGANYWGNDGRTANTPDYVVAAYRAGASGTGLA